MVRPSSARCFDRHATARTGGVLQETTPTEDVNDLDILRSAPRRMTTARMNSITAMTLIFLAKGPCLSIKPSSDLWHPQWPVLIT